MARLTESYAGSLAAGAVAGALGTLALNVATYADMALRGRPSSEAPASLVGKIGEQLDLDGVKESDESGPAQNRRSGLGALAGYLTGIGVGSVYGLARAAGLHSRLPASAGILAAAAMAGADVPLVASGTTNLASWSVSDWLSDLLPHLTYGLVGAIAYEQLAS